jgi:hypothetical protein
MANHLVNRSRTQYQIAQLYYSRNEHDSALRYSRWAFATANKVFLKSTILESSNLLAKLFKEGNHLDSAFHYLQLAGVVKDSLYGQKKFQQLQLLLFNQEHKQQQLREKQVRLQNLFVRFSTCNLSCSCTRSMA